MMLFIQLLAVIISDRFDKFRTSLSAFPGHIIASERRESMPQRIMQANLFRQHGGDFRSPLIGVNIIDFIADRPHDYAGMSAVPSDPGSNVMLIPLRKETGIIIFGYSIHLALFSSIWHIYKDNDYHIFQLQQ